MSNRAVIVALDGPSGIGKSSVINIVQRLLALRGQYCRVVANNEVALLNSAIRAFAQDTTLRYPLALLTAAARGFIRTKSENAITLCDRGLLSTLVFQGFSGIPLEYLYSVNQPLIGDTLFVLLKLPEDTIITRRKARYRADSDWFKQNLSVGEEIILYGEAADFLVGKGHRIVTVSMEGSVTRAAEAIASTIENELGVAYG